MIQTAFEFIIRLSTIWLVLFIFYKWAFQNSSNWKLKRTFLLSAYLLGWILPLLPSLVESSIVVELNYPMLPVTTSEVVIEANEAAPISTISIWEILACIYLLGVIYQAFSFGLQYMKLLFWKTTGQKSTYKSHVIIRNQAIQNPFASLGVIFLPIEKQDSYIESMICAHESAHLDLYHNSERIPLIIGQILLWFHPLQWLYINQQSEVQEFEADDCVLQEYSLAQYGKLLIQTSMLTQIKWRPGFYSSPLKKRINMMTKRKIR
ncbi:MAG: M56 family metallopeptidase, partial [Bacteroidota bacterium]